MLQMNDPIIQLKGLTKCYGKKKAVDGLDLAIRRGEIFGLLGPNGAGKTTTILMMLGLTEPTEGTAYVCGFNATREPIAVKRTVGYMPDSVGFYDSMTALENLLYIGRLNGLPEHEVKTRATETLALVGLAGDMNRSTYTFSRGMKQRLGLADVLIKKPAVIILDEPTLGIDPAGVREFLTLIRQLSRQHGITVLISSHHLHHVQQVCDRVGIFVNGKLEVEGNIDTLSGNLLDREGYSTTVTLVRPIIQPWPLMPIFSELDAVKEVSVQNNCLTFFCTRDITPSIVRLLVDNGCDITGVHQKDYGLDDIYQKYFENNAAENTTHEKSASFLQRTFLKEQP
ncbi:ABC transporter ATP-binding protein [Chitinophaga pinensis]|uniref:ABC transporter related n=1 Tax=Chitinophaga pinensis (strain ATCC 43595 / DSM 2588 / LMG 13176 / NBRC 15968 / NCIMB 11800 / UQM 2034) TaxID=485918 RepID=A0A979GQH1_CHIPD|nr:ABC transporter ATP-binding protein [Chitinophaga pinensis]ACU60033.1 ABC transporter related [Chitinophaga pinensis DSM 2588]